MGKKAIVILAEGFEEIEATTVIDMLRRAEIEVTTASLGQEKVTGAHGISLMADKKLSEAASEFDAVILPGGLPGASNLAKSEEVNAIIKYMFKKDKLVAAICAAPAYVLSPLGILNGRKATCYPAMKKDLDKNIKYVEDSVVVDGNVITSRGPATAIAFSLAIIDKLSGKEMKEKLSKATLNT